MRRPLDYCFSICVYRITINETSVSHSSCGLTHQVCLRVAGVRYALWLAPQIWVLTATPLLIWRGWPVVHDHAIAFTPSIVSE